MTLNEALILFISSLLGQTLIGIVFDWTNFRLGQRWYKFPSKKEYYITFLLVALLFTISYWLSFSVLPLIY
jgi:hypothetical protein